MPGGGAASESDGEGKGGRDLGHDDVFSPEAVVGIRVVAVHLRDGDARFLAEVAQRRDLGLGLQAGHEPAGNARDDLVRGCEGDEIRLGAFILLPGVD